MPFGMLAPFLASMGSGIMNKLTGSTPTDGTQITGAGNDAASGGLGGGMGSIIGGMGKDMLGGISTGLTNQVTDNLFGSSADKDKEALDKLYPGTSAWDRLQGGGGGVTTPAGGSAVQKQQMSIPEKVAKINADATKYAAKKNYDATTGRVRLFGQELNVELAERILRHFGLFDEDKSEVPSGWGKPKKDNVWFTPNAK